MPTLKALVQASAGPNLIVTGPHSMWMERLEHEKRPSQKALLFAVKALLGGFKHERPGRFSPSAIGNPFVPCSRAVLFGYAGAPQLPPDIEAAEMMDHGTIGHLKWQIEGLTAGYLKECEVWAYDPDLLCGGSIDGILYDDSIFELKTAGTFAYNRVVTRDQEAKYETLIQLAIYMLLMDVDWGSVVMEDRSSGSFHEFRQARDAKIEAEVLRRLKSLKSYVEFDDLPAMLDMCEQHMGQTYKMCGYRKICPLMKSVSMAQRMALDIAVLDHELGRVVPDEEELPDWAAPLLVYLEG